MFRTFEEFKQWLNAIPDEEKEPFCPFEIGYCDVAYTEECFKCQGKDLRFDEQNSVDYVRRAWLWEDLVCEE